MVVQTVMNHLQCGRPGFSPCVGKIPWDGDLEIIPVIFSDYNAVRLDLNYRKKKSLLKFQTYGG